MIDCKGRVWPDDPKQCVLVKYYNVRKPYKNDRYEVLNFRMDVRHLICQNIFDYSRRGESNRCGSGNRGWRKHTEK